MSVIPRLLGKPNTTSKLAIEPMRRRHLREVLKIEHEAYPKSWSRSVFESELGQVRGGSRYYTIVRIGGQIVGYSGLWFVDDQAHVTNMVVLPSQRRRGVATRLMLDLAREAIGRGCAAWTLEVRASNSAAQELYRQFGFAPAGVRKRYYENTDDAIVMWCHDIDTDDYADRLEGLEEST